MPKSRRAERPACCSTSKTHAHAARGHGTRRYGVPKSMSEENCDRYSVEVRVRYAECDAMGYLHHAKYWEYFELVRTEQLRENGFAYRDLEARGVCFVVYKAACKYIRPIRYDDLVTVIASIEGISSARVDHTYEILRDGELACEATSTLACVGRDGRPRPMPEALWSSGDRV